MTNYDRIVSHIINKFVPLSLNIAQMTEYKKDLAC